MINIAIVDDHVVIRDGLVELLKKLNYSVVLESSNGKDLINRLSKDNLPDLVLMDINMPQMDGYDCTKWLTGHFPDVRVLALSGDDNETPILRMIRSGARGYLSKNCNASELKQAIQAVCDSGYYYSEVVTGTLLHSIHRHEAVGKAASLSDKEIEFIKLAVTEMTYKEIADKMFKSPRTIDSYRESVFEKLEVSSRTGIVLFAIKNRIVNLH